jgi:hypothetical protein
MWALLKFLVWTGFSIWLGVFAATRQIGGRTPVEHFERFWNKHGFPATVNEKVKELKGHLSTAVEDTKDSVSTVWDNKPRERHSREDRQAVDKLIAKRQEGK